MNAKFNPKVSFYKNVFGKEQATAHILKILEAIKNGRWAKQIELIRSETDAKKRAEMKKYLPAFTASGVFTKRTTQGLVQHTGLLQIDIDHVGADQVEEVKWQIAALPYWLAIFRSPSGDGVKALVRIPANAATHVKSFYALEKLFADLGLKIDPAVKDITRLCFVSYDPQIYINENPKVFPFFYTPVQVKKKVLTTAYSG